MEVLSAYWAECERRIYPLAASNPDGYMRAVQQVRQVADALRDVEDLAALAQKWEQRSVLALESSDASGGNPGTPSPAAGPSGGSAPGAQADAVLGAGFSLRANEIRAAQAEADRQARIAAAKRNGSAWVVLHQQGDLHAGLADPYQHMELHIPTGLGVVCATEPDPSTMAPLHVVTVMALEPPDQATQPPDPTNFTDRETHTPANVAHLRHEAKAFVVGRLA